MEIIWHGQSCFSIKTKEGTIVIDPFAEIGLPELKLKADIVLVTHDHPDHNNISAVKAISSEKPFIVSSPGEYEIGSIVINGLPSFHDNEQGAKRGQNTIYTFSAEDITLCHLGDLGQKFLSDQQLETLNGIDILMVPVGGNYTIDGNEAGDIVSQIEPKIVIPMHYKIPNLTIDIEGIEKFAKAEGLAAVPQKDLLKINSTSLPQEERETIILKPKS
jgi:L-ascorbate metabolism protein UlaG (beta-lactamase superfamily)